MKGFIVFLIFGALAGVGYNYHEQISDTVSNTFFSATQRDEFVETTYELDQYSPVETDVVNIYKYGNIPTAKSAEEAGYLEMFKTVDILGPTKHLYMVYNQELRIRAGQLNFNNALTEASFIDGNPIFNGFFDRTNIQSIVFDDDLFLNDVELHQKGDSFYKMRFLDSEYYNFTVGKNEEKEVFAGYYEKIESETFEDICYFEPTMHNVLNPNSFLGKPIGDNSEFPLNSEKTKFLRTQSLSTRCASAHDFIPDSLNYLGEIQYYVEGDYEFYKIEVVFGGMNSKFGGAKELSSGNNDIPLNESTLIFYVSMSDIFSQGKDTPVNKEVSNRSSMIANAILGNSAGITSSDLPSSRNYGDDFTGSLILSSVLNTHDESITVYERQSNGNMVPKGNVKNYLENYASQNFDFDKISFLQGGASLGEEIYTNFGGESSVTLDLRESKTSGNDFVFEDYDAYSTWNQTSFDSGMVFVINAERTTDGELGQTKDFVTPRNASNQSDYQALNTRLSNRYYQSRYGTYGEVFLTNSNNELYFSKKISTNHPKHPGVGGTTDRIMKVTYWGDKYSFGETKIVELAEGETSFDEIDGYVFKESKTEVITIDDSFEIKILVSETGDVAPFELNGKLYENRIFDPENPFKDILDKSEYRFDGKEEGPSLGQIIKVELTQGIDASNYTLVIKDANPNGTAKYGNEYNDEENEKFYLLHTSANSGGADSVEIDGLIIEVDEAGAIEFSVSVSEYQWSSYKTSQRVIEGRHNLPSDINLNQEHIFEVGDTKRTFYDERINE